MIFCTIGVSRPGMQLSSYLLNPSRMQNSS